MGLSDCPLHHLTIASLSVGSNLHIMKLGTMSAPVDSMMFAEDGDPGLLVAFEGLDGSGKTTQRKLLKAWHEDNGEEVIATKWNSSSLFKG